MKKEITIFVSGAKDLTRYPLFVQKIMGFLSRMFGFDLTKVNHVKVWKSKSYFQGKNFIWLHWLRGIGPVSKYLAKRKLSHLLNHYKNDNINLVGVSLGGEIILEVVKRIRPVNVKKIILVGSVNENKNISFPHPEIFNFYSDDDKFAKLATKIYSIFFGSEKLYGEHISNINLPHMQHHDFCLDTQIRSGKYKGKRITELIRDIIIKK